MDRRQYDTYHHYPAQHVVPPRREFDRHSYAHHDSRSTTSSALPVTERTRLSRPYSSKARSSWPPQPFAEEEVLSLSRESGGHHGSQNPGQEEAPSRGTIDQEPVIMDVPDLLNQHERRFVIADQKLSDPTLSTRPASEDERSRKARRKLSSLSIKDEDGSPIDLTPRSAAPYSMTKPNRLDKDAYGSARPSSAGASTTSYSSSTNGHNTSTDPKLRPKMADQDAKRLSRGESNDYANSDESAIDDTTREDRLAYPGEKRRPEKPQSESIRYSAADSSPLAANAPPIRKINLDARRNTDTQNTLPTLARLNLDRSRRTTPLTSSSSLSEARNSASLPSTSLDLPLAEPHPYSRSREHSYTSSRGPSPAGSTHNGTTPPSRSPRMSTDYSREGSINGSRPPSSSGSRPVSPSPRKPLDPPRMPKADLDWDMLLLANAARRAKPPSRLATSQQHSSSMDGASAAERTPPLNSLPYPEDSSLMGRTITMPEEQDHAYYPAQSTTQAPSTAKDIQRSVQSDSPIVSTSASYSSIKPVTRPALARIHSINTVSPAEPSSAGPRSPWASELKRSESFATTSDARRELGNLMKKGLPPCTRPELVAGYDDWYTVLGATTIDVCPDCILFFERTIFRSHFRRSLPRNLDEKVRCAFGSPWVRLAWLLTLQQHRTDLILLKDLAEIEETTDPCPGTVEMAQSWYGLRDTDGLFVRDFHVCYGDVRKIERLLPTLAGIFVKLPPRASSGKRTCAIRTESNRFSVYLDTLVSTHEKAMLSRKGADPMPLIDLVEHKTRLRECTRDNMLIGGLWHFIPDISSLTVCEDCFESVVEPQIKAGSYVAKKFNRTVQPVYGEGIGSSCQLYSRRMRKVFQRAVEDSDLKYLIRKSKERRDMELWLQDKYKDVMRRAKRLSQEGSVSEDDERRLTRDLERISSEWKTKWE